MKNRMKILTLLLLLACFYSVASSTEVKDWATGEQWVCIESTGSMIDHQEVILEKGESFFVFSNGVVVWDRYSIPWLYSSGKLTMYVPYDKGGIIGNVFDFQKSEDKLTLLEGDKKFVFTLKQ
ncbi:MAG: hypothetical protein FWG20_07445 [Candidatus Cloacimonetes bacterium]|nr:hypothetical protein [Candidatus Cloacimonadota bacterium]